MVTNNLAMGEHIYGEEERAEHRSLGYAMIDWSQGGDGMFQGDIVCGWKGRTETRRELRPMSSARRVRTMEWDTVKGCSIVVYFTQCIAIQLLGLSSGQS